MEPLRQRQPRVKDKSHLRYIASLPCCICGGIDVDAAHIRATPIYIDGGKRETGGGEKPSDCWTVPLCRAHHTEQHAAGNEIDWWRSKGIDPFILAMQLSAPK